MKRGPPNSPILYKHCPRPSYLSPHHLHSQRQSLICNLSLQSDFAYYPDLSNQVLQNVHHSSTMQFKSIIAVLALAFAVAANPVDPVAVKLVPRTTPTPAPAPVVQTCKAGQVFISQCKSIAGIPVNVGTGPRGLISVLSDLVSLGLGLAIQCLGKSF